MAWLSGWNHRKSHTINSASGAGTNYQVLITVHYGNGSDVGDDVYCNSKCKSDFGDIRFTDNDQTTELDYWMEKKVDSDYALFWVKVNDDLSSSNAEIYVYYGESSATTTSDGDDAFIFFDHFGGASIDMNKWQGDTGNTSVSDSILYFTADTTASFILAVKTSNYPNALRDYPYSVAIESYSKMENIPGNVWSSIQLKNYDDGGGDSIILYDRGGLYEGLAVFDDGSFDWFDSDWDCLNWHRYSIRVDDNKASFFEDGNEVQNSPRTSADDHFPDANDMTLAISVGGNYAPSQQAVDWIALRKFVDPEPAHGSWGSEEVSPLFVEACFEAGDLSEFDDTESSNGTVTATSAVAHHGTYSCKCDVNADGNAYAEGYFDVTEQQPVYCRGYFRFNQLPETDRDYTLISFENTSGPTTVGYIQLVDEGGTKKWKMKRTTGGGATYSTSTSNIPEVDTWVCVEFAHGENLAKLWVDDKETMAHADASDQTIDKVHIGACSSDIDADDTLEIHIDCIVVTDDYIGPETEFGDLEVNNLTVNNVITIGGDTNLYSSATDTLKTDDSFTVGGNLSLESNLDVGGGEHQIYNCKQIKGRTSDDVLRLDGNLLVNYGHVGTTEFYDGTGTKVFEVSSSGEISFGSTSDTNIYREDSNILKTDDYLHVGNRGITVGVDRATNESIYIALDNADSPASGNPTFTLCKKESPNNDDAHFSSYDGTNTLVYWEADAGTSKLKCYQDFMMADDSKAIEWSDVNLYRSGTNTLKTDYTFAANEIQVGTSTVSSDESGAIELGDSSQSGTRPYIDFHYGMGGSEDFNVRIQNYYNKRLDIKANSSDGQLNLVNMELAFESDAKISRDSANSLVVSGALAIDGVLRTNARVFSYDEVKLVDDNAPQLTKEEIVEAIYGFEHGKWKPGNFTLGDCYLTLRNDTDPASEAQLFVVNDVSTNEPLVTTNKGLVVQKDISAGGFVGSNQGAIGVGSGLQHRLDVPKIVLMNSGSSRLGGGGFVEPVPKGPQATVPPAGSEGDYFLNISYNPDRLYYHNGSSWENVTVNGQVFWNETQNKIYKFDEPEQKWDELGTPSDFEGNFDTLYITTELFDGEPANLNCGKIYAETLENEDGDLHLASGDEGKVIVNGDLEVTGDIIGQITQVGEKGSDTTDANGEKTVTFAQSFDSSPLIFVQAMDPSGRGVRIDVTSKSTTQFSVKATVLPTNHKHKIGEAAETDVWTMSVAADGAHYHGFGTEHGGAAVDLAHSHETPEETLSYVGGTTGADGSHYHGYGAEHGGTQVNLAHSHGSHGHSFTPIGALYNSASHTHGITQGSQQVTDSGGDTHNDFYAVSPTQSGGVHTHAFAGSQGSTGGATISLGTTRVNVGGYSGDPIPATHTHGFPGTAAVDLAHTHTIPPETVLSNVGGNTGDAVPSNHTHILLNKAPWSRGINLRNEYGVVVGIGATMMTNEDPQVDLFTEVADLSTESLEIDFDWVAVPA